jgi:hypothetical protein
VDVLITPEARREIEALRIVRPGPATWGALIGHKRGPRFIVEKVFQAGSGRVLPNGQILAELDRVWPGRVIGLFAIRPGTAFKKAVLGPAWYDKLIIHMSLSAKTPGIRPFRVEFERNFFLVRISLVTPGKAKAYE